MKISCFLLFFGLAAHADPGCWKAIEGKAITDSLAKTLPADCQEFRKTYLKSLKTLSKDPQKFSHDLSKQILAKKSFQPPYDAILISTFPKKISDELKSAIHSRARIETTKQFKYKYAAAAEERILQGSCSPAYSEEAYDEVCRAQDQVYARIEKLQGVAENTVKNTVKK